MAVGDETKGQGWGRRHGCRGLSTIALCGVKETRFNLKFWRSLDRTANRGVVTCCYACKGTIKYNNNIKSDC